jgi:NodT family efflux transporter outer membrane factor (OMF) lipoprotein
MPIKQNLKALANHSLRAALTLSVCALLAACTQGVDSPKTLAPVDTPFSASDGVERPAEWWLAFEDPELNRLIDQALANSPDLLAVWERLQANEALARRERSGLFPQLDATGSASSQREDGDGTDLFSAGLSAGYEVDLWGRIRSQAEAERLRAEATKADYETAALTLTGEVALAWYRLLSRKQALALIEEQIAANKKVAESLMTRFRGGEARSVDVLRQEQLIEATRELKLIAEADIAVLKNQLQVLLGNAPQKSFQSKASELPSLPPVPETGLPAELLLRRPDLESAYLELLAADRDLASAISERFPRIDLTASLRTASEDSSELFDNWLRRVAGDLVAPVIDGGNRRAEVDRQAAIVRQRMAEFTQASLVAYREVEDALVQEKQETLRHGSLSKQVELQQTAFRQLQSDFLNGVGNFIDVLTAQTGAQQLQRDLIESMRRQIEFRIALHRSLAGPIQAHELRM